MRYVNMQYQSIYMIRKIYLQLSLQLLGILMFTSLLSIIIQIHYTNII